MTFQERLHPRQPDGKVGHGHGGQMTVTSRTRGTDAVTRGIPAGGKPDFGSGPKDASHDELMAADRAGKKVQMHHFDPARGWVKEGPPGSAGGQIERARHAITHAGQAGKIRLTVVG